MDVKKELEKIATAQRVPLNEDEKKIYSRQIEQVLAAFDRLDQVNTDGSLPSYHPIFIPTQLRPDTCEPSSAPTGCARRIEKGYLRGPRMMKTV